MMDWNFFFGCVFFLMRWEGDAERTEMGLFLFSFLKGNFFVFPFRGPGKRGERNPAGRSINSRGDFGWETQSLGRKQDRTAVLSGRGQSSCG